MLQGFIAMLVQYEHRIGLLVGSPSLAYLRRYIQGSADAFKMCGYPDVEEALTLKWEKYVEKYYNTRETCGWENLIARNTVDGEESIKVFYILLRSYLHEFYPQIGCDT